MLNDIILIAGIMGEGIAGIIPYAIISLPPAILLTKKIMKEV